jgi:hypothetical protein
LEILALLLLGLIAMLAIVPPIIRGKLDESPLASTQSFQRSMQEMANSIESGASREETRYGGRGPDGYVGNTGRDGPPGRPHAAPARISSRQRASVRRNRIAASLTVFAAIWGAAALLSGTTWCMVVFAVTCGILAVFWAMALIIPNMKTRPHATRRPEKVSRSPRSQAL